MTIQNIQEFLHRVRERISLKHGEVSSQTELVLGSMVKLTEEVGELAEQINKWRGRQDERKGDFEMQDLEKELADVILAAILMGDELGIDVSDAIQKKTAIVKQRREE